LQLSNQLRGRADSFILQNLARACELNGLFELAKYNYNLGIFMTSNEVIPFWLRSALVKYQLYDIKGGYNLLKRIEVLFLEAPEVRAASAVFLYSQRKQQENDDMTLAQLKFLEIPNRQRLKI
jgi:hypothetical protein